MAADKTTRFTLLVALNVHDAAGYQRYRDGMTPVLAEFGGRFDLDIVVGELLCGPRGANRVFTISFPSETHKLDFFADERYLEIRSSHFDQAVSSATLLAEYTGPA